MLFGLIAYVLLAISCMPFALLLPQLSPSIFVILGVLGFGIIVQLFVFITLGHI